MPKKESSSTETQQGLEPKFEPFKARGLKNRVKIDPIKSFDDILSYTESYEDLLYFKKTAKYYMNRFKRFNNSEKDLLIFSDILAKADEKLRKLIALSLYNSAESFKD